MYGVCSHRTSADGRPGSGLVVCPARQGRFLMALAGWELPWLAHDAVTPSPLERGRVEDVRRHAPCRLPRGIEVRKDQGRVVAQGCPVAQILGVAAESLVAERPIGSGEQV